MDYTDVNKQFFYLENKIQIKKLNGLNTEKEQKELSDIMVDAYLWAGDMLRNQDSEKSFYQKGIAAYVKNIVFDFESIPLFANAKVQMVYSHLTNFFDDFIKKYHVLKCEPNEENMITLLASFDVLKEFFSIYRDSIENITEGEPMSMDELYVPEAEYFLNEPDNSEFFPNMDRKIEPIKNIIKNAINAYHYHFLHEQLRCMLSLAQLMDDIYFILSNKKTHS